MRTNHLLLTTAPRLPLAFDGASDPLATVPSMTGVGYGMTQPIPIDAPSNDPLASIDKPGADHQFMSPYWNKVAAIMGGVETLRLGKDRYLPMFPGETEKDYLYRVKTCRLTNVYRDIVETLAEKPFTEECKIIEDDPKPDERILELGADIDGRGNSIHVFAATTFFEAINNAIDWILVEFPTIDTTGVRTVAQDRMDGVRPYWVHIPALNVLETRTTVRNGKEELTYIRIWYPGDKFDRVRIMEKIGDVATFVVYEREKKIGAKWIEVDSGPITIGVIPIVPIVTGRRYGGSYRVMAPLRDAADLQIEVFQSESGLKNTKTLAAYPMLAANGITPERDPDGKPKAVVLGPNSILYGAPDGEGNSGTWERLAADAPTMTFLRSDVDADIQQLRELGRQPLTAQSGGVTRISAAMAASKGNSAVQSWALRLKDALELALVYTCRWLNIDVEDRKKNPKVHVFTDFDVETDEDKTPEWLLKMREGGTLSMKTLWSEMKRRGILSSSFDAETEAEEIAAEGPSDADLEDPATTDPKTGLPIKKPVKKPPVGKPAPKVPA